MNQTTFDTSEIADAMNRFYRGQIIDIFILLGLLIIGGVLAFIGIRLQKNMKRRNKVLGYTLIAVCAVVGSMLCVIKFIPAYQDYTQQSYIIAEDAELFIHENSSNWLFDNHDDIDMITADGERLPLKLYQSNSLSKKETYCGTVVYTVHSRAIIWYSITDE